ncbi:MAG: protease modulator HflC [Thiohalomonadaceae bacterium]
MSRGMLSLIALLILLWLGSMSIFVVSERQLAIKFRLGELVRADYTPGLYIKFPFINNVRIFDKRIMTLDVESERYLTQEKKNVIVDSFIKWRISDVATYYVTMRGDEQLAALRLAQVIKDGLRSEFGKRTMQEAISGDRSEIMNIIVNQISEQAKQFGIEVVDVRIKRIELPATVSTSVYQRMEAERSRVAKDLRSRGAEAAERIRADADRQSTVIMAEAYRDAERTRGEGDGRAAEIYAKAHGRNVDFYAFYRSLDAYKSSFNKPQDMLVVDPGAEFFQYFNSAKGGKN